MAKTKQQERLRVCQSKGPSRIQSIITASKTSGDYLHLRLERDCATDKDISLSKNVFHGTRPKQIRYISKKVAIDTKAHVLYCRKACIVEKDSKNPS